MRMKPEELKIDKTNPKEPYEKPKMVVEKIELATVAGSYSTNSEKVVNGKYRAPGSPSQTFFGTCGN